MKQKVIGIIGLGKMGGQLGLHAIEKGWKVVGHTLGQIDQKLIDGGLTPAATLDELRDLLPPPRVVLLYIPAGDAVDSLLEQLTTLLSPGDLILDGGNSYWGDSIRRYSQMKEASLGFIDLGTSGGVSGARNGACFMAGGEKAAVDAVSDLLTDLAVPGGFVHAGPPGAGHFTKLVHNGIEFGMLQAIGEGMNLLENWPESRLPINDILKCWTHGSVIRSWLIELMQQTYSDHQGLEHIPPYVEDTGEVNWLVSDALHMEVPIPVIAQSVMQLFASRDHDQKWARAISMMRHGFGGHPYGPFKAIAEERQHGRLTDAFLEEVSSPNEDQTQ